jgi:hypothetical protein
LGSGVSPVIVVAIHHHRRAYLFEVAQAHRLLGSEFRLGEHWKENGSQYRDDHDDHEEFNKSEAYRTVSHDLSLYYEM